MTIPSTDDWMEVSSMDAGSSSMDDIQEPISFSNSYMDIICWYIYFVVSKISQILVTPKTTGDKTFIALLIDHSWPLG